jgi:long-chain acyl-CoA synthetase
MARRAEFKNGFLPKQYDSPPYSYDAPGHTKVEGETLPRRQIGIKELMYEPEPGIATTWDIVVRSEKKFGDHDAVGSRKLIRTHEEIKKVKKDGVEVDKKWTYYEMGPYVWKGFREWKARVEAVGSAYRKLGLVKGDGVYIFAATGYVWFIILLVLEISWLKKMC